MPMVLTSILLEITLSMKAFQLMNAPSVVKKKLGNVEFSTRKLLTSDLIASQNYKTS